MNPVKHGWVMVCLALGLLSAGRALGQEAMYTAAATMPSKNTVLLREQFFFSRFGSDPQHSNEHTDLYTLQTTIAVGVQRALALYIDVPLETRVAEKNAASGGGSDTDTVFGGVDLTLKWRFYQEDLGGVDTVRAAFMGGVRLDADGNLTADPHIGVVLTAVLGRHGFNQELKYTLTTGSDDDVNFGGTGAPDAFTFNSAYVFRVWPEAYTSESKGAWYATAEVNGLYETNGDLELKFSPGIMFEGREFGFEIMAQLPLYQHVRHRPELDFSVGIGFRYLF